MVLKQYIANDFRNRHIFLTILLAGLLFLSGCSSRTAEAFNWHEDIFIQMPSPAPTTESIESSRHYFSPRAEESPLEFLPFIIPSGPFSRLTGLPIYEEYQYRRPLAAVINNSTRALPQSGIGSADIIYEVLAEGDVTRLVGIFQSYIPEKIGPMRSARDYFVDFAFNHDALFIHHGASPGGYSRISTLRITNLDGMALEGTVFWRDRTYPYWAVNTGTRPLEHSSYTGYERLFNHIENRGIRDYWHDSPDNFGFNFSFFPPPFESEGGQAYVVTIPYSALYFRRFVFDHDTGLYMSENRQGEHMDAVTEEQVSVRNILIQFTPMRVIDGVGRRTVDTVGSGDGYLIHGGRYQPVRWARDSHTDPTRWYFPDGTPLVMHPGRVWVCVFQSTGNVVFE
ncbi:MAG: DUF3048 domain-containing protein [Defluviitaleaceae bacterium]|nr:DUF3048 domain-containing protein [Defluviitaleaceae bacterium]